MAHCIVSKVSRIYTPVANASYVVNMVQRNIFSPGNPEALQITNLSSVNGSRSYDEIEEQINIA